MPVIDYCFEQETMTEDDKTFYQQLGRRVAKLRKEQHITQVQLADTLEISQQLIAAYESGQRRIPAFVLLRLSQLFNISIEELYGTKSKPAKRGPASTLHRQIEQIRQLPKSKQKFVMEMLDTVIRQQSS
jgi:transcriptional regulator with XRE-family HTH domain